MILNFETLRRANVQRCETSYHGVNQWTPTDWACAMAGEAGEVCNEVKKLRRIASTPEELSAQPGYPQSMRTLENLYQSRIQNVADELADVLIYADLLAARLGINLSQAVIDKFNAKSLEIGSDVFLSADIAKAL